MIRDKWYHDGGYELSLLTQAFCFRLCARSHKKGRLACHLTLFPHTIGRSRAACFSPEERVIIAESYEEYKYIITAKSNTVSAHKAREECWHEIADRVNSLIKKLIRN